MFSVTAGHERSEEDKVSQEYRARIGTTGKK